MADILIKGMEMPTMAQAYKTLIVSYDGKVYEGVHPQPTAKKEEPIAEAIELPPHGDLIDRDALVYAARVAEEGIAFSALEVEDMANRLPVIIPADKEVNA